jgi:regulator of nonsense transcripts 1
LEFLAGGMVTCTDCREGFVFCNAASAKKGSHLVSHLTTRGHNSIAILGESAPLSCVSCRTSNVFELRLLERARRTIYCKSCIDKLSASVPSEPRGQGRRYVRVNPVTAQDVRTARSVVQERKIIPEILTSKRSEWKAEYTPDINDQLEPIPDRFESEEQYMSIFGDILNALVSYEERIIQRSIIANVKITWTGNLNGNFRITSNKISFYKKGTIHFSKGKMQFGAEITDISEDRICFRAHRQIDDVKGQFMVRTNPNIATISMQQEALTRFRMIDAGLKNAILGRETGSRLYPLVGMEEIPLDKIQKDAINHAVHNVLTIIQGPPGTGKTTVAAHIIKLKLELDPEARILVTAPSNNASDNLAKMLHDIKVDVVRVIGQHTRETTVPQLLSTARASKEHKREHKVISEARVIVCTCAMAFCGRLKKNHFDFTLIDEATQATEPEVLTTLVRGTKQLVLVGDQKQLGPTVLLGRLLKKNFGVSLYERLWKIGNVDRKMLTNQYRMHPELAAYVNEQFYEGRLVTRLDPKMNLHAEVRDLWINQDPRLFLNVTSGNEEIYKTGGSYRNSYECEVVKELVELLIRRGIDQRVIGVITFYQGQVQEIKISLNKPMIKVSTVDGFQGKEKDYIILSCVRSNVEIGVGFIADVRRLNVALTRARRGMIILGNQRTLVESEPWRSLHEHIGLRGSVIDYDEYRSLIRRV